MRSDSEETRTLLRRAREGDRQVQEELFSRHRERLRRMVRLRLDTRLRARIDASDVIQDTYLEACRRLDAYLRDPKMPFFLWLRFLTGQRVAALHRHHLGAQRRDARQEVRLFGGALPEATSVALAHQLMGRLTAPSKAAARVETKLRLEKALNSMDAMDREVLTLRHFEQLTNAETADELGIEESTASKRYVRALKKLTQILSSMPGDWR